MGQFETMEEFIDRQELDIPKATIFYEDAEPPADLDAKKEQGAVVDSNIVVFPKGTPVRLRNAVSNWTLFAQRAASKKVDRERSKEWVDAYVDVLLNTGWSVREEASAWSEESVTGSVVHQKILDLVAVALGPVPTALAIVTAALNSLQGMNERSRWITLFDRRGKSATSVGFSVANVEPQSDGAAALRSIDFRVEARKVMTQVLFFRFTHEDARMFKRTLVLSIAANAIDRLGSRVEEKVMDFAEQNIATYDV